MRHRDEGHGSEFVHDVEFWELGIGRHRGLIFGGWHYGAAA